MQIFGQDNRFWIVVLLTAAFKIMTSKDLSPVRVILTVAAALFSAWAFSDAILDWFSLNPEIYRDPILVLLGLTGEGLMRWLTSVTPEKLVELIKKVRNG